MIERATYAISQPLANSDRKRAYLLRLIASPMYDEHEHARRVASGLAALRRLHSHWQRVAARKALAKLPKRPLLTLAKRRA